MAVIVMRTPHSVLFAPFNNGIGMFPLLVANVASFVLFEIPASSHVTPPSVVFSTIIWSAGKNASRFALAPAIRGLIDTSVVQLP